jgi:hypothetical protein
MVSPPEQFHKDLQLFSYTEFTNFIYQISYNTSTLVAVAYLVY